jgi:hypothetical protein
MLIIIRTIFIRIFCVHEYYCTRGNNHSFLKEYTCLKCGKVREEVNKNNEYKNSYFSSGAHAKLKAPKK